jgi:hypothetical protein
MLSANTCRHTGSDKYPRYDRCFSSGVKAFLCLLSLTYFHSYQALVWWFVLEPPMHVPMTDIIFCSRILIASFKCKKAVGKPSANLQTQLRITGLVNGIVLLHA